MTDNVNHPPHYTSGGLECIEAMVSALGADAVKSFCLCNAFKYIWRSRNKNGIEDIQKANWYLAKYLDMAREETRDEKAVELPNV